MECNVKTFLELIRERPGWPVRLVVPGGEVCIEFEQLTRLNALKNLNYQVAWDPIVPGIDVLETGEKYVAVYAIYDPNRGYWDGRTFFEWDKKKKTE